MFQANYSFWWTIKTFKYKGVLKKVLKNGGIVMDSKQFGVYALIIAAVVLIAIGFNNVTGQVGKNKCTGTLVLQSVPSEGGAYFKAIISSDLTKFDNNIYIDNVDEGYSYTAKFDCGAICNIGTLESKNGVTKRSDGQKEIVTPTKTMMTAGNYVASIKDPCSSKEITSSFKIR